MRLLDTDVSKKAIVPVAPTRGEPVAVVQLVNRWNELLAKYTATRPPPPAPEYGVPEPPVAENVPMRAFPYI